MDFDDLGLDRHDKAGDRWREKFASRGLEIVTLASKYRNNQPCIPVSIAGGSFNFCVQVRFEDDVEWMIRFPIPGRAMHPEQKTKQEVATMKFLQEKTSIPIPALVAYGLGSDNHLGLGPFIITEFVEGRPLSELLQVNPPGPSGKVLRPDIEDSTLDVIYRQIADILIELSRHDFDKIGSLALDEKDDLPWSVGTRPLTLRMNEMERCGNLTMDDHLEPFETTVDYLYDLAQQNFLQLYGQRNCVDDAEDAREKYICRQLFQAMVPHFTSREHSGGPFKLYCDDFRPGNILVDENLRITAILDWEWCYAAPYQLLYSPPRWLLLKPPIHWREEDGLDSADLLDSYMTRFEHFVRILEEQEEERGKGERDLLKKGDPQCMSSLMRQSMEDGTFWFNEATRESFSLDKIWWNRLDELCFGPRGEDGVEGRVKAFSRAGIHRDLDAFVTAKMGQLCAYKLEYVDEMGEETDEQKFADYEKTGGQIEQKAGAGPFWGYLRRLLNLSTVFPNLEFPSLLPRSYSQRVVSLGILAILPTVSYYSISWFRRQTR